jgi:preprotein translocase subunit SecG
MLFNLIVVLQVISALVIIGLVLLQHGKGADMGAAFGSGASGSLFGATGSSSFLSKSTAIAATIFFSCTLALSYLGSQGRMGAPTGGGVLERAAQQAPAAPASSAPVVAPQPGKAQVPAAPAANVPAAPAANVPAAPAATVPAAPAAAAPAPAPANQIPK